MLIVEILIAVGIACIATALLGLTNKVEGAEEALPSETKLSTPTQDYRAQSVAWFFTSGVARSKNSGTDFFEQCRRGVSTGRAVPPPSADRDVRALGWWLKCRNWKWTFAR
jgi:hypothetical protein